MAAVARPRSPPRPPRRRRERPQVSAQVRRGERPQVSVQVRRGEGRQLPPEIIVRILREVVESDGAVPFLCRASRVCRLWRDLAADPRLWLRVHLGPHLGAHLGGSARGRRPPEQVLGPLRHLAETRFSHLQAFVLCDWSSRVGAVLQALSEFCPHLRHLELRRCQVEPAALGAFLAAPPPLQHLHLTCPRLRPVLPALAAGACPQLRVLELDPSLGGPGPPLPLPLERLQAACPLLQVLRLSGSLGVSRRCAPPAAPPAPPPGFPRLQELGLGDPGGGDGLLRRLLRGTPALRGLELRGCPRVTPQGLLALPCAALERLSVAVPPDCPLSPRPGGGPWVAVTRRWHRTLLELDLSGRRDPDLGGALAAFGPRDPLRVLRLAGTPVTPQELSPLLACPQLSHLDLSSCRRLPRGTKRAHLGRGEVLRLLRGLAGQATHPEGTAPGQGTHPEGTHPEGTHPEGTLLGQRTAPEGTVLGQGTHPEGTHPEGTHPEGTLLGQGTAPEGTEPEGTAPEMGTATGQGTAPEGTPHEGTEPEGTAPEGTPREIGTPPKRRPRKRSPAHNEAPDGEPPPKRRPPQ